MMISKIIPKKDNILLVMAEDGRVGRFDLQPYLEAEAFRPLKDPAAFARIHNGRYFVEWDCGADLSADTIEARWELLPDAETAGAAAGRRIITHESKAEMGKVIDRIESLTMEP